MTDHTHIRVQQNERIKALRDGPWVLRTDEANPSLLETPAPIEGALKESRRRMLRSRRRRPAHFERRMREVTRRWTW